MPKMKILAHIREHQIQFQFESEELATAFLESFTPGQVPRQYVDIAKPEYRNNEAVTLP